MLRPSITVTRDTSIQDLKAFADAATGKERLKARENDDGSVTLYQAKHSKPQLWSKIMGHDKQSDAAVKEGMNLFRTSLGKTSHWMKDLANLVNSMPKAPTSSQLRVVMSVAERMEQALTPRESGPRPDLPSLNTLMLGPRAEVRLAAEEVVGRIGQGGTLPEMPDLIDRLAQGLATGLTDPLTVGFYPDAIFSDGAGLVAEIAEIILSGLDNPLGEDDRAALMDGLKTAFNRACNLALGGLGISDDRMTITIGDETFHRAEYLGQGAFGIAYRYESNDGTRSVAVKFPIEDEATLKANNDELAKEIPAHSVLSKEGGSGIIGLEGALRMDDGLFAIVTELASGKDASHVLKAMGQLRQEGAITQQEVVILSLMMAADMAEGLDAMHDAGMAHLDFKPPNAFISQDGRAKVADFGTAANVEGLTSRALKNVENMAWKDHTILYQTDQAAKAAGKDAKAAIEADAVTLVNTLFPDFEITDNGKSLHGWSSGLSQGASSAVRALSKIKTEVEHEARLNVSIDGPASDAHSLGVTLVNMLTGSTAPFAGFEGNFKGMNLIHSRVTEGRDYVSEGGLIDTLGDPALDALVNALTAPNPQDRPQHLADFLTGSEAFGNAMIGSPEARALLLAIASGDPEAIQANRLVPTAPATPDVAVEET